MKTFSVQNNFKEGKYNIVMLKVIYPLSSLFMLSFLIYKPSLTDIEGEIGERVNNTQPHLLVL